MKYDSISLPRSNICIYMYIFASFFQTIEDMDLDNDRKDLINREIESFRKRNEVKLTFSVFGTDYSAD